MLGVLLYMLEVMNGVRRVLWVLGVMLCMLFCVLFRMPLRIPLRTLLCILDAAEGEL